jgi:hypothetical protein
MTSDRVIAVKPGTVCPRGKETVQRSMIKPTISILDSRFQYTNSARTNIRQTFERARKAARQDQAGHEGKGQASNPVGRAPVAAAPIQIRRKHG